MPLENWSDRVMIANLSADPGLSDDLQALIDRMEKDPVDVVMNLAAVRYVNSSHIARLLKLRKATVTAGNRLILCAVDNPVWSAFLVTGLDKLFEFSDGVPTALASLQMAHEP